MIDLVGFTNSVDVVVCAVVFSPLPSVGNSVVVINVVVACVVVVGDIVVVGH